MFPPWLNADIISTTEIVTGKDNGEEGVCFSAHVGAVRRYERDMDFLSAVDNSFILLPPSQNVANVSLQKLPAAAGQLAPGKVPGLFGLPADLAGSVWELTFRRCSGISPT